MAQTIVLNTLDETPGLPQFTVVQEFELAPTGLTSDEAVSSPEIIGGGEESSVGFLPI